MSLIVGPFLCFTCQCLGDLLKCDAGLVSIPNEHYIDGNFTRMQLSGPANVCLGRQELERMQWHFPRVKQIQQDGHCVKEEVGTEITKHLQDLFVEPEIIRQMFSKSAEEKKYHGEYLLAEWRRQQANWTLEQRVERLQKVYETNLLRE